MDPAGRTRGPMSYDTDGIARNQALEVAGSMRVPLGSAARIAVRTVRSCIIKWQAKFSGTQRVGTQQATGGRGRAVTAASVSFKTRYYSIPLLI